MEHVQDGQAHVEADEVGELQRVATMRASRKGAKLAKRSPRGTEVHQAAVAQELGQAVDGGPRRCFAGLASLA